MAMRSNVTRRNGQTQARRQGVTITNMFGRKSDIYVTPHWIFTGRSSGVQAYGRKLG